MKNSTRNWIGAFLILFGTLQLLEEFNLIQGTSRLLWGALLVLGGSFLLADQRRSPKSQAWKLFPALALIGLGAESLLPEQINVLEGVPFLAALGVAFLMFMFAVGNSWWAVIPAGVFFSLALTNLVENTTKLDAGGIFLIGLGLTFFVLSIFSIEGQKREWGYIPGLILVILGGAQYYSGINKLGLDMEVILPVLLIAGGVLLLFTFARGKGN